jgi:GNAT superfamily N-acetyltransferase
MLRTTLSGQPILIRRFSLDDAAHISTFLYKLSPATQQRFAPHGYAVNAIQDFYQHDPRLGALVAIDTKQETIIGYVAFRQEAFEHDLQRYTTYTDLPAPTQCMNYAPSVADAWQGKGLGKLLLQQTMKLAKSAGMQALVLWGGVQCDNEQAIHYYRKNGFIELGSFMHQGCNLDMCLPL